MHNNFYGFHPKHCINILQVLKSEKTYNDSVTVAMWTKSFFVQYIKPTPTNIKESKLLLKWWNDYNNTHLLHIYSTQRLTDLKNVSLRVINKHPKKHHRAIETWATNDEKALVLSSPAAGEW